MSKKSEISKALASLEVHWNLAEKAIKQAEQINAEIVNPAIYELRYAGRRLVEAMPKLDSDPDSAKKLIEDAIFDCCRARHDAIDAATSKISADFRISIKKIGPKNLLQYFPKFTEIFAILQDTRRKIVESRGNRDNRDEIYKTIQESDMVQLISGYNEFLSSESLFLSAAKKDRLIICGSLLLAFFGLIATIGFGIMAFF